MHRLPVTVGLRENARSPGHTLVSVFVGRRRGARGHAGELTLRTDEWDELAARLGPSDGGIVEAWPPYVEMVTHELRRGDVLDSGATITGDVHVNRDAGEVVAEVDHRHLHRWPAYRIVRVHRPTEEPTDARR